MLPQKSGRDRGPQASSHGKLAALSGENSRFVSDGKGETPDLSSFPSPSTSAGESYTSALYKPGHRGLLANHFPYSFNSSFLGHYIVDFPVLHICIPKKEFSEEDSVDPVPDFGSRYDETYADTFGKFRLERIRAAGEHFLTCGDYRRGSAADTVLRTVLFPS